MNEDDFVKMMMVKDYYEVDTKKFKSPEDLRKKREEDMMEIYIDSEKKILKNFEFLFDPNSQVDEKKEFEECQEFVKKNENYEKIKNTVFSTDSHDNKKGAFLYKGDHLWTYYLEKKNLKMTFLMIKSDETQCTFKFLHKFDKDSKKNYPKYTTEITDKWATLQENWSEYLKTGEKTTSGAIYDKYFGKK
jgi:hypothetical protein